MKILNKISKCIASLMLLAVMVFNPIINNCVYADSNEYVTLEEYDNIISSVYAQYGINAHVSDMSQENVLISVDDLKGDIKQAVAEGKAYQAEMKAIKMKLSALSLSKSQINKKEPNISALSMPIIRFYEQFFNFSPDTNLAGATFRVQIQATVDANTDTFMYVDDTDQVLYVGSNIDSYTDLGSYWSISNDRSLLYYAINYNVKYSYTIGFSGQRISAERNHHGLVSWRADDNVQF